MHGLTKILIILLVCVLPLGGNILSGREITPIENKLNLDISDHDLDDFDLIEAAFILSGATHEDSLSVYLEWYDKLIETLKDYHFNDFDRVGSAGKVFSYLHSTWLITYREEATTLINVVRKKRFNCVAGTILYNLVCQDLGWATEAFETPTHTYTVFPHFTEQLMVENTTPMGFNIMRNLRDYSQYLLRFYPQKKALQIGLDRIYAYENSNGRRINNTELLGLLAYNRGYFAVKEGDYDTAYQFVLLAQKFNRDSRSNINFEKSLYMRWGKTLFDRGSYYEAYDVYANAYYRYWDQKEYAHDLKVSFFEAMRNFWQEKEWSKSQELILDILELDILRDEEIQRLQQIMHTWAYYFFETEKAQESRQLITHWQKISPGDPRLKAFERAVKEMKK
jgi:hypothetical protein